MNTIKHTLSTLTLFATIIFFMKYSNNNTPWVIEIFILAIFFTGIGIFCWGCKDWIESASKHIGLEE